MDQIQRTVVSYIKLRKLTIAKFLVVSGSAVLFNLLLLYLMVRHLGFDTPLLQNVANALAIEASVLYNFFMSRGITWRHRVRVEGSGLWVQILKFHLAIGITMLFRLVLFPVLQAFGVFYLYNAAIGIALSCAFNFVAYDTLVFRKGE